MLERYLTSPATIWALFIAVAAFSGFAIDAIGRLFWVIYKRNRVITAVWPEVPGEFIEFKHVKKQKGNIWTRKHGDEGTDTILRGDAAYPSNWGPVHIVDKNGFNLVAPPKDEPGIDAMTGEAIRANPVSYKRFRIWDHLVYWRANRENDMEDLYSAQKEKEHWAVKLAPLALIVIGVMAAVMAFVAWKVLPIIKQAGN